MVSYFKTQWFNLAVALICLVMCCVYTFSPAPDTTTIEGLDKVMSNMVTAGLYFLGFRTPKDMKVERFKYEEN